VNHNQTPSPKAVAQQQESGLSPGLIGIIGQPGTFVEENGLGFLEGDSVLTQV
jgi:hypothetical protein